MHKDNQQLYTIGKNYKSKLKDLEKYFLKTKQIYVSLYQHFLSFIEILILSKIINKLLI